MAELVTGFAGTPHISSDEVGRFIAGTVGSACYALDTGNGLAATLEDANTVTIASGDAIMYGRHVTVPSNEQVTISSGTQGMNRNDIIGFLYAKNASTDVESVALHVYEGTATSGTPTDPEYPTASILDGVAEAFMPLYRVSISGITAGEPVALFEMFESASDATDELSERITTAQDSANNALGYLGTAIPSGANLNTYTAPGVFYSASGTITNSLSNKPDGLSTGFRMEVKRISSNSNWLKQFIYPNNNKQFYYVRQNGGGTWTDWVLFEASPQILSGATGQDTATNANSYREGTINFSPAFASAPAVSISLQSTSTAAGLGGISCAISEVTASRFKYRIYNNTSTNRSPGIYWTAIGDRA